jgi:hypothetical protein
MYGTQLMRRTNRLTDWLYARGIVAGGRTTEELNHIELSIVYLGRCYAKFQKVCRKEIGTPAATAVHGDLVHPDHCRAFLNILTDMTATEEGSE